MPFYNKVPVWSHREIIRGSRHLNKLLYDNIHGLRLIYEKQKDLQNLFTRKCAKMIFLGLKHPEVDYRATPDIIEECFLWSMMNVTDESSKI
jgi:hypothetical protein